VGLSILVAGGCRFPELPIIGEDASDDPADSATIDTPTPLDATDAPVDAVDARPVRTGPLVTNNQAADLVVGQPSFGTNADRGVTAQSFQPDGIAFASGRLWATDYFRHRLLGWNTPTASDPAASFVLGQTTFTNAAATSATASTMFQPTGVAASGSTVITVDSYNRALVWTGLPTGLGQNANLVLGQPDFSSTAVGTGPTGLRVPLSAWTDGTRVIIRGGFGSMRMWLWSSFPAANAAPSDLQMLGGVNTNATEFTPGLGVFSDGARLVISDWPKHRVMIWNTIPVASGTPADVVVGQPTFSTDTSGASAATLNGPQAAIIIDGALVVADGANDRVLFYDPVPTASGASASYVLGQVSTTTATVDQTPSDRTLNNPIGLAFDGRHLYVSDHDNRRVLRYTLNLP
jgi:hypothetical protein